MSDLSHDYSSYLMETSRCKQDYQNHRFLLSRAFENSHNYTLPLDIPQESMSLSRCHEQHSRGRFHQKSLDKQDSVMVSLDLSS